MSLRRKDSSSGSSSWVTAHPVWMLFTVSHVLRNSLTGASRRGSCLIDVLMWYGWEPASLLGEAGFFCSRASVSLPNVTYGFLLTLCTSWNETFGLQTRIIDVVFCNLWFTSARKMRGFKFVCIQNVALWACVEAIYETFGLQSAVERKHFETLCWHRASKNGTARSIA